jgi:hypothetical protein
MPNWLKPAAIARTSNPWLRSATAARWLYTEGRKRLEENLSAAERRELGSLMAKSKGRRSNLTDREVRRFTELVRRAARGR